MLIVGYDSLRTSCLTVLDRLEDPLAPEFFDLALSQAEDEMFLRLRAPWTTRAAQFTFNSDDGPFEYLPNSYSAFLALLDATNGRQVDPIGPADMETWLARNGYQKYAVIITGYMLQLVPTPENGHPFFLYYYSRQERLSEAHPVNDIIDKAPSLYFNGTCTYLAKLWGEMGNSQDFGNTFGNLIEAANISATDWMRNVGAAMSVPGGP